MAAGVALPLPTDALPPAVGVQVLSPPLHVSQLLTFLLGHTSDAPEQKLHIYVRYSIYRLVVAIIHDYSFRSNLCEQKREYNT